MNTLRDKFTFTLQSLTKKGRHWDISIPLALFRDESFDVLGKKSTLLGDMVWQGSLLPSVEQFVLSGTWKMMVPRQCGRCNADFMMDARHDVSLSFVLGQPQAIDDDTESVIEHEVLLPPGELDILAVLREQFWLAWQPMAACSPACKGLCPQCGVNLNDNTCACHGQREEHPFAALQGLKFDT